jgi:hypothetical protein
MGAGGVIERGGRAAGMRGCDFDAAGMRGCDFDAAGIRGCDFDPGFDEGFGSAGRPAGVDADRGCDAAATGDDRWIGAAVAGARAARIRALDEALRLPRTGVGRAAGRSSGGTSTTMVSSAESEGSRGCISSSSSSVTPLGAPSARARGVTGVGRLGGFTANAPDLRRGARTAGIGREGVLRRGATGTPREAGRWRGACARTNPAGSASDPVSTCHSSAVGSRTARMRRPTRLGRVPIAASTHTTCAWPIARWPSSISSFTSRIKPAAIRSGVLTQTMGSASPANAWAIAWALIRNLTLMAVTTARS